MSASQSTPQSSAWNLAKFDMSPEREIKAEKPQGPVSVLFVCLGNICRSPMAEAVFKSKAQSHHRLAYVDSCGTGAYHTGDSPDPRTMKVLRDHGINGYTHHARKIQVSDFVQFDYILAMDRDNLRTLQNLKIGAGGKEVGVDEAGMGKVMLFGDFGSRKGEQVGDPYYGARDGFTVAYEQMKRFSEGFITQVLESETREK